jgi:ATP-dependent metalloprotease
MDTCTGFPGSFNLRNFFPSLVQGGEARVTALLKSKEEELHRVSDRLKVCVRMIPYLLPQLAHALVEHETLDSDEVRKVIKGEQIRNIDEIIAAELSQPAS